MTIANKILLTEVETKLIYVPPRIRIGLPDQIEITLCQFGFCLEHGSS